MLTASYGCRLRYDKTLGIFVSNINRIPGRSSTSAMVVGVVCSTSDDTVTTCRGPYSLSSNGSATHSPPAGYYSTAQLHKCQKGPLLARCIYHSLVHECTLCTEVQFQPGGNGKVYISLELMPTGISLLNLQALYMCGLREAPTMRPIGQ